MTVTSSPELPQQPAPAMQPVYVVRPPTSGAAVAALVASLIGPCTLGVASAIAVFLGHVAMRETRNGERSGRGMAMAGLIMGYLVAGPMLLWGTVMLATWVVDQVI